MCALLKTQNTYHTSISFSLLCLHYVDPEEGKTKYFTNCQNIFIKGKTKWLSGAKYVKKNLSVKKIDSGLGNLAIDKHNLMSAEQPDVPLMSGKTCIWQDGLSLSDAFLPQEIRSLRGVWQPLISSSTNYITRKLIWAKYECLWEI